MINTASSMPSSLSGVSGLVRGKNSLTGQKLINKIITLGESVRGVRGKFNSLIHAHPRVSKAKQKTIKYSLGNFKKTGHPGQKVKAIEIVNFLLSGLRCFSRTLPGHPGQIKPLGSSRDFSHEGNSHLGFYTVLYFF